MPFFENARNINIGGGNFNNYVQVHYHGSNGLQTLLEYSLPEAAHDSSAQRTSPSCLPGTREQYIDDIAGWVRNHSLSCLSNDTEESPKPSHKLLWFNGPFGVGKSAIARTCAEVLEDTSELGAAFFFSRPNKRDDPAKLFTTIAYQLATRLRPVKSPYGALLEEEIRKERSILTKAMAIQLDELIVGPVLYLLKKDNVRHQPPVLIVVDGLDECNNPQSQCEIIRLISRVALDHPTLPLLWAVFSRPEPHITAAIRAYDALWWEISLQISDDSHKDIEVYLRHNFARIRQQYNLSFGLDQSWPSESEIKALVEKSAGLFIYAATVVRFFDDPMLPEREQQLSRLLSPRRQTRSSLDSTAGVLTPLSHLDAFYLAIMERIMEHIPRDYLVFTLNVLLVLSEELFTGDLSLTRVGALLGYSVSTIHSAIYSLHSVLFRRNKVQKPEAKAVIPGPSEQIIGFYHYSFVEFLRDPSRSGEFCVLQPTCQKFWASRCLKILSQFSEDGLEGIELPESTTNDPKEIKELRASLLLEASCSLLTSCARIKTLSEHSDLIIQLYSLDFVKIVGATDASKQHLVMCIREEGLKTLMKQLSLYNQNQPWSRRMPRLIRERLQVMNIMTQQYHNVKYIVNSALCSRTNSYDSVSSSASDSSFRSIGSSAPSTPSRVLPTYELGQQGKTIYLYPESSASGVTYHVSTSLDDLEEPYIFSDDVDDDQ